MDVAEPPAMLKNASYGGNKVANLHKKFENRRSYLQQLHKDVE